MNAQRFNCVERGDEGSSKRKGLTPGRRVREAVRCICVHPASGWPAGSFSSHLQLFFPYGSDINLKNSTRRDVAGIELLSTSQLGWRAISSGQAVLGLSSADTLLAAAEAS